MVKKISKLPLNLEFITFCRDFLYVAHFYAKKIARFVLVKAFPTALSNFLNALSNDSSIFDFKLSPTKLGVRGPGLVAIDIFHWVSRAVVHGGEPG